MRLVEIIRSAFPDWNERVLYDQEAIDFCVSRDVHVLEDAVEPYGQFCRYKGVEFVVMNPHLCTGAKRWVLWHEVGHVLLHEPSLNFSIGSMRKADHEANLLAAVALLPRRVILGKTVRDISFEYDYPLELIHLRAVYAEQYGI